MTKNKRARMRIIRVDMAELDYKHIIDKIDFTIAPVIIKKYVIKEQEGKNESRED